MHKDRKSRAITPARRSSTMPAMRKPTDPMRTTNVALQDPQRVIIELEKSPMAQQCVGELKRLLQVGR
jgi:hypothetical protein